MEKQKRRQDVVSMQGPRGGQFKFVYDKNTKQYKKVYKRDRSKNKPVTPEQAPTHPEPPPMKG
jgi:hypothetical protein